MKIDSEGVHTTIPVLPPCAPTTLLGGGLHTSYDTISTLVKKFDRNWIISYGATPLCMSPRPERIIVGLPSGKLPSHYSFYFGTQARYLRELHAKIYLLFRGKSTTPELAIVGSMNYVYSGMCECAIEIDSKKSLKHLVAFFEGLWIVAKPIQ